MSPVTSFNLSVKGFQLCTHVRGGVGDTTKDHDLVSAHWEHFT